MENTEQVTTIGSLTTEELREHWQQAIRDMDTSPTYYNAVRVQKTHKEYEASIAQDRKEFFVIDGSNGLHYRAPVDILIDALKEISDRAHALDAEFGYLINQDGRTPFMFVGKVADQALKDVGA
jgi:hypothetical protein